MHERRSRWQARKKQREKLQKEKLQRKKLQRKKQRKKLEEGKQDIDYLLAYAGFSKLPLNVIVLNFFVSAPNQHHLATGYQANHSFQMVCLYFLSPTRPITDFK